MQIFRRRVARVPSVHDQLLEQQSTYTQSLDIFCRCCSSSPPTRIDCVLFGGSRKILLIPRALDDLCFASFRLHRRSLYSPSLHLKWRRGDSDYSDGGLISTFFNCRRTLNFIVKCCDKKISFLATMKSSWLKEPSSAACVTALGHNIRLTTSPSN